MKKLFVSLMAVAALVSCSKDNEDILLQSSKKSVAITIANSVSGSRAESTPATDATLASTNADKLVFIFADAAGNKITALQKADATAAANEDGTTTYTFHNLSQTIAKVGVIANGVTLYTKDNAPATLALAEEAWKTETVGCDYAQIIVYGSDNLERSKNEDGTDATCQAGDVVYPLYEAAVTVEPYHARVEIPYVSCDDLGTNPYGYKKLTVNNLTLANKYTQNVAVQFDATVDPAVKSASAPTGKIWSWNILEQNVSDLVVGITLNEGNNWTIPAGTEQTSVTVVDYKAPAGYANTANVDANGNLIKFVPGEIYRLGIPFSEANIDNSDNKICVDVTVTIANWVIVDVTPEFKTN